MRKSNFALRLQPSLLDEARQAAEAEGVALNQLINVAVTEKLVGVESLKRAGVGNPPRKDDKPGRTDKRTSDLRTARKADRTKPSSAAA